MKKPDFAKIVRVDEAEETVRAICDGSVDAFVVQDGAGHRVYTLEGADLPYNVLVERMQQGAAILDAYGNIIYANPSLAQLMGVDHDSLVGLPLQRFLNSDDQVLFQKLWRETLVGPRDAEMSVRRADGTGDFEGRVYQRRLADSGDGSRTCRWRDRPYRGVSGKRTRK